MGICLHLRVEEVEVVEEVMVVVMVDGNNDSNLLCSFTTRDTSRCRLLLSSTKQLLRIHQLPDSSTPRPKMSTTTWTSLSPHLPLTGRV